MNAFARGQQHSFTQLVLDTMEKLKVEKTKEIYTAAMGCANDVFGEGSLEGGWEWSLGLLTEMRSTEVEVDSVALGVALSVCLRARCWEVALKLATCLHDFLGSVRCGRSPKSRHHHNLERILKSFHGLLMSIMRLSIFS